MTSALFTGEVVGALVWCAIVIAALARRSWLGPLEVLFLYWLVIPQMARFHGTANALGFALCGLVGWTLASRE